jgi:hypothetical protein
MVILLRSIAHLLGALRGENRPFERIGDLTDCLWRACCGRDPRYRKGALADKTVIRKGSQRYSRDSSNDHIRTGFQKVLLGDTNASIKF